jgi:hypothetical protein
MLHYNNINLDILTETFNSYFYAKYLIKWPQYCVSLWSSTHSIQAYCKSLLTQCWEKLRGRFKRSSGMAT